MVATSCLRKHVLVLLDECFLTSPTLLSARVSNVGLAGGCRGGVYMFVTIARSSGTSWFGV